ncbi:LamG-like jellyroll fold domain-containing protein [Photobacterium sp. DNB23_23_1]|uniref:Metallophosphoesterase n=1 Tax=Photobacterium pectinilyticum TaxID=2906793 RepID=A0ABT1N5K4_9GAMM|nr:LamG-like jellyroll fold domain-containing protein [Photobacterium sp. ZSDE20]MCQ1059822.1 metallophosphoesterase [Photobacterium sp. ZSDE20]MDD1826322.1 metallophosphoesterase [Photobacterium sp. ZSDE20]
MITRRIFLKGATATMAAAYLTGCNSDSSSDNSGSSTNVDFKLAVLPDTQKYSENSPERYNAQTRWIAENWENEKIPFTIHLGDIVEDRRITEEWVAADYAMSLLETGNTPYSILCGNHDLLNQNKDTERNLAEEPYFTWFPESRMQQDPTFMGRCPTGFNSYHIFQAPNGQEFLSLAMDWRPSEQSIAWAQEVLDRHATIPTILSTHQLINIAGDGESPLVTNQGVEFFTDLIYNNDQIFLTLNGHHHGASSLVAYNKFGREVLMAVVDYQAMFWGGNGLLRTVGFDYKNNKMVMRSFSPYVMEKMAAGMPIDPQDQLNLTDAINHFDFPMNFKERFNDLNNSNNINAGPGGIEGTRAHWILDKDRMIVRESAAEEILFQDLSGLGNHLVMKGFSGNIGSNSRYFDMTDDNPGQGFASGSMLFLGDKRTDEGVYLETSGVTLSDSDFKGDGFTIETFIKLPNGWNSNQAGWGGILCHQISRTQAAEELEINGNGEDAAMVLATSTLREMQFESLSHDSGNIHRSWSWDLGTDSWHHIAVVNRLEESTGYMITEMFVDGALTMRNQTNCNLDGLAIVNGFNWTIGASHWDGRISSPLIGYISEVRIVDRPLDESEWLTA